MLRLVVIWFVAKSHSADWFFSQASELARLAESIRSGHGLSSPFGGSTGPSAFLAPGYPALVATVFAIFHPYSYGSAVAIMCLQALFSAATVGMLMLLAGRLFGNSAATVAGIIWAISPPLLWLPTLFWETSLSVFLATTIATLAFYCGERPTLQRWLVAGLLSALTLSVNPSLLPILVSCFGWAFYKTRSQPLSSPAAGLALCLLLWSPWVARNYHQLHTFIPLRSNMGYELWQGNRPGSDGFFSAELHPNTSVEEFSRYRVLGEVCYMREKSVISTSAIRSDPSRFLWLSTKRAFYFWTGIVRESSALVVAHIVLTSLAGLFGLFLLWRRNRELAIFFLLPLLLFPAPYYITHPDFRFRLVIDPILTALAAYALTARSSKMTAPSE